MMIYFVYSIFILIFVAYSEDECWRYEAEWVSVRMKWRTKWPPARSADRN